MSSKSHSSCTPRFWVSLLIWWHDVLWSSESILIFGRLFAVLSILWGREKTSISSQSILSAWRLSRCLTKQCKLTLVTYILYSYLRWAPIVSACMHVHLSQINVSGSILNLSMYYIPRHTFDKIIWIIA